jgi:hypothetical protein
MLLLPPGVVINEKIPGQGVEAFSESDISSRERSRFDVF